MNTPDGPVTHGHNEKPCPVCKDIICMARKTFERTATNTTESSTKWSDQRVARKLLSFARSIHALRMKQDRDSERKTK